MKAISLQAEILELKANPKRAAQGAVIEAQLDVGRGPVATVLVQKGTLNQGDIFVVGEQWGKVRALINDKGERIKTAGPSVPVEVLGLNGTPEAGDVLNVVDAEAQAREIADYRADLAKEKRAAAGAATTLEQLMAKAKEDENVSELPILVKADVQGSAEAIVQAMEKIGNDEVRVRVLHYGVGAITDTDVGLRKHRVRLSLDLTYVPMHLHVIRRTKRASKSAITPSSMIWWMTFVRRQVVCCLRKFAKTSSGTRRSKRSSKCLASAKLQVVS